jgi:hypothetical protein
VFAALADHRQRIFRLLRRPLRRQAVEEADGRDIRQQVGVFRLCDRQLQQLTGERHAAQHVARLADAVELEFGRLEMEVLDRRRGPRGQGGETGSPA